MLREAMTVIEQTDKRRSAHKDFSEATVKFARYCVDWITQNKRVVTPMALKDTMCLLGPNYYGSIDEFILDAYAEIGTIKDTEEFLHQEGIEWKETEDGDQTTL